VKEYPEKMELHEIWDRFTSFPFVHLATVEGSFPRVRPICLIAHKKLLWAATHTSWDKVHQIRNNGRVEFTLLYKDKDRIGGIRAAGRAQIIDDPITKETLSTVIPFFNDHWSSPTDPEYTLLRFDLDLIRVDHTDGKKYTVLCK
jgi:general stress protein 26